MKMNYNQVVNQIIDSLEKTKFAVLATANSKGIVCATQMTLINDGLTVFFQSKTFY